MDIKRPQPLQRAEGVSPRHKKQTKLWVRIVAAVATLALVTVGVLWSLGIFDAQRIDGSKYQVVYMTNGQAYFGKLQNTTGEYLVIKTPYAAQAAGGEDKTADAQTTIVKVSGQLYGPEDSIALKSDQVAFWQNLRNDSKVSQAISTKE